MFLLMYVALKDSFYYLLKMKVSITQKKVTWLMGTRC